MKTGRQHVLKCADSIYPNHISHIPQANQKKNFLNWLLGIGDCPHTHVNIIHTEVLNVPLFGTLPVLVLVKTDQLCGTPDGPVKQMTHAMLAVDTFAYLQAGGSKVARLDPCCGQR